MSASRFARHAPITAGMLISRLRAFTGRFFADRRAVVAVSAVGLAATMGGAPLSNDSPAVGSAVFLAGVALLAFEFGVTAGPVAAALASAPFLSPGSEQGSA